MKYLFCVLLALSLAACGKETEDPGLSREEFLDLFPLHEHGEVYVEPFYVRFYYPGGNCLLFPTDILGENIIGTGMALKDGFATMGGFKNMNRLISFFGRANYGYDDRYLFSASLRYEGSSKFGANHKWGLFYACLLYTSDAADE